MSLAAEVTAYVYRITNQVNGKVYIGRTVDPKQRWDAHLAHCRKGRGYYIHAAMRKYGEDRFYFDILETHPSEELAADAERRLIAQYQSTDPTKGYNIDEGGVGVPHGDASRYRRKFTYEQCQAYCLAERITGQADWKQRHKAGALDPKVPANPADFYRQQWPGWAFFLAKVFTFEECRDYARSLHIRTFQEWKARWEARTLDGRAPHRPEALYRTEWPGWAAFLGQPLGARRGRPRKHSLSLMGAPTRLDGDLTLQGVTASFVCPECLATGQSPLDRTSVPDPRLNVPTPFQCRCDSCGTTWVELIRIRLDVTPVCADGTLRRPPKIDKERNGARGGNVKGNGLVGRPRKKTRPLAVGETLDAGSSTRAGPS